MTARTGAIAIGAALPGAAARISPPGGAGRDARQTAARCGARPSPGGDSRGAAQPEPQQLARDRKRRRRAEHRHLSRAGRIPARIAQQRARAA